MGRVYKGNSGKEYIIEDNKIAGGGEGGIHLIENNDSQVAKIFKKEKRTAQREEKLLLMVNEKLNEEQLKQVTWPQDVLYDQSGFAGYVMPRIDSPFSLTEIYSTDKYDFRYRVMVAINLCAAVDTIHEMGQVCGDLNPQNICINLDETDRENAFHVTLVDTDSYHFSANGKTYRCEVGLGDYLAPELQKKLGNGLDLKSVPLPSYTRETDLFALAVHIFCLLMNGCHPFACAKETRPRESNIEQLKAGTKEESIVAPQPIENIVNGFFAFVEKKEGLTTPIYAPGFDSLPLGIRQLFIKTFVEGYSNPTARVAALEWQEVLTDFFSDIIQCKSNDNHYYFSHNAECPLCVIDKRISSLFENDNYVKIEEPKENKKGSGSIFKAIGISILFMIVAVVVGLKVKNDFVTLKKMGILETTSVVEHSGLGGLLEEETDEVTEEAVEEQNNVSEEESVETTTSPNLSYSEAKEYMNEIYFGYDDFDDNGDEYEEAFLSFGKKRNKGCLFVKENKDGNLHWDSIFGSVVYDKNKKKYTITDWDGKKMSFKFEEKSNGYWMLKTKGFPSIEVDICEENDDKKWMYENVYEYNHMLDDIDW